MKTFIYLPLIALIILTSCKSNSFNSQRYTKLAHSSHKTYSHETVVVNKKAAVAPKEVVETEVVKSTQTPVQLVASGMSSLKESILKPERKVYSLNSTASVNSIKTESVSKDETVNTENSTLSVSSQKSASQKTQHSRGFIGSALATALWIVLVVIFIILIIFLISALL